MNAELLSVITCEVCGERPGRYWVTWPPRRLVCPECRREGEEVVENGPLVRRAVAILGRGEPFWLALARALESVTGGTAGKRASGVMG